MEHCMDFGERTALPSTDHSCTQKITTVLAVQAGEDNRIRIDEGIEFRYELVKLTVTL